LGRQAQHLDLATGEPAGVLKPGTRGARLAMAGRCEYRVGCAGLERPIRREPTKFDSGAVVGESGTIGALGRESHVDIGGGSNASRAIGCIGSQTLVIAGPVGLLMVRSRDRVQGGEGRRAA